MKKESRYWVSDMSIMFKNADKYPHGKRYEVVQTKPNGTWTTVAVFNHRILANSCAEYLNEFKPKTVKKGQPMTKTEMQEEINMLNADCARLRAQLTAQLKRYDAVKELLKERIIKP